jgi:hypothetical protein
MQFEHVDTARIARLWPVIAETVWPAVQQDSHYTLEVLRNRLMGGLEHLFHISGGANCFIVLEIGADLCCWVKCLAGSVDGGPKQRALTIRQGMHHIENIAKAAGCTELKLCGRDWSRIFPEYTPFDGFRSGLKKDL